MGHGQRVSRRTFVRSAAACGLAAAAAPASVEALAAAAKPQAAEEVDVAPSESRVHNLSSARHLFIDDWLTERKENVTLTVNPPQDRQLVLIADKPWERGGITCYCNVFWDTIA